ncbi:hypothetical protein E4898_18740 [Salmonella enterica subsp. enterica serovar Anatum]|uniref:Uncharacterized protein n=2 Tax=Salmonella enterica I TaxID=59201 RepID=A0A4S3ECX4_SALAN|nr:hypothetical protein [Salmonella enterica]EAC1226587.1 hypothetical protein [Salmonella enterica subsp. enterica serovar Anatum]EAW1987765.1 hypothetical protein [Salmonella enterica subsp. enterica]ECB3987656.1 hypothetical protein [Salmonella enterica subsp. enterica serovar Eko]ECG5309742.1 hypothetical protein [Salmonella enterica subsp. enterica serovar Newington]PJK62026.1 hypothetical protein CU512_01885 [Salmonella enterica subsp. enterica serovar Typhimurium]
MRGVLFNELIIGRIHCLVSHITCLLVIVIKAAVNAAQNNKGSRDGGAIGKVRYIRTVISDNYRERCPAGTGPTTFRLEPR